MHVERKLPDRKLRLDAVTGTRWCYVVRKNERPVIQGAIQFTYKSKEWS